MSGVAVEAVAVETPSSPWLGMPLVSVPPVAAEVSPKPKAFCVFVVCALLKFTTLLPLAKVFAATAAVMAERAAPPLGVAKEHTVGAAAVQERNVALPTGTTGGNSIT